MRRILLVVAMLLVCAMCVARTYGLTLHLHLHLHSYVPPRAEVAWNGEEPVVVSNFNESATAAIEEREGYQVVTFTAV